MAAVVKSGRLLEPPLLFPSRGPKRLDAEQGLWRAYGLKPHRVAYFKLSTDPEFVAKLRDVVGLYVDPPKRAVVFSFSDQAGGALEAGSART
jgi:hypothetical protein